MMEPIIKRCRRCLIWKGRQFFTLSLPNKDRMASYCKVCANEINRLKYENDPDYKALKRANKRIWREQNLEHARAESRRWMAENSSKANAVHAERRARRTLQTPAWANREKMQEFYFAADFLGMVTGEWHHVDHIVPLKGKIGKTQIVCGLHCEQNLQVLTAVENLKKNNLVWPNMP